MSLIFFWNSLYSRRVIILCFVFVNMSAQSWKYDSVSCGPTCFVRRTLSSTFSTSYRSFATAPNDISCSESSSGRLATDFCEFFDQFWRFLTWMERKPRYHDIVRIYFILKFFSEFLMALLFCVKVRRTMRLIGLSISSNKSTYTVFAQSFLFHLKSQD